MYSEIAWFSETAVNSNQTSSSADPPQALLSDEGVAATKVPDPEASQLSSSLASINIAPVTIGGLKILI